MTLATFSVVVLGDSFPVQSIKTSDFRFRHRDLKETMRVPVALQAENAFVTMQVLPERFEVGVKTADHLEKQIEGVSDMLHVFLDYAGRRTITAIGHNAQWVIENSADRKTQIAQMFTNQGSIENLLEATPTATDLMVQFAQGSATMCQLNVITTQAGDASLHFNFHYDLTTAGMVIETAIESLRDNLTIAQTIGARAAALIAGVVA